MVHIEASEFPFVENLPKREKSRVTKLVEHFQEVKAQVELNGMLVPVKLAADISGVSPQRILQLCEVNKLVRVELHGHPFITEKSLVAWAGSERKTGRPLKQPETFMDAVRIAAGYSKHVMDARHAANKEKRAKEKARKGL